MDGCTFSNIFDGLLDYSFKKKGFEKTLCLLNPLQLLSIISMKLNEFFISKLLPLVQHGRQIHGLQSYLQINLISHLGRSFCPVLHEGPNERLLDE